MSSAGFNVLFNNKGAARSASFRFFLFAISLFSVSLPLSAQTELGVKDDLTVLGTNGTALDPNTEIKGFTVFGATQAAYAGAVIGPGNVVVNGALAVSSGAYFTGVSTFGTGMYVMSVASFTDVANIYITGGADNQVLAKNGANGPLKWTSTSAMGDNLGDHTATKALDLAGNQIMNVSTLTVAGSAFSVGGATFTVKAGSVGIGTAAPAYVLDIRSAGTAGTLDMVNIANTNAGGFSDIIFGDNLGAGKGAIGYANASAPLLPGTMIFDSGLGVDISLATDNNFGGSVTERLRIKAGSGNVGISTGAPQARLDVVAAGSAAADMAQIWRKGDGSIVSSMSATGVMMAVKFVGDGSGLTGVMTAGDNLGDHTATQQLKMGNYAIWSSSSVNAAQYQISGSTVLAVLPGAGSFGVGPGAGRANAVGGNYNVFVGQDAGYSNTTGDDNVFVGYTAGHNNTTGTDNVFLGEEAGYYNVSGKWNFYLGTRAGIHSTSNDNIFIGSDSGYTNTTGSQNMFIGSSAGTNNNTGREDIFMGYYAGHDNVDGIYNTYVGLESGYSNVSGQMNSIFGYKAGLGAAGNSYSNNSLFGYYAGGALTTGSNNLLLGGLAGDAITSGASNIVIGYGQDASAPAASNELNIGGVLYGDLAAKTVGISTRAPQAALDVVSTGTAANIYAQIWRNGGGVVVASMTSTGTLYATLPAGTGNDNLGNHTATQDLNMNTFNITGAGTVSLGNGGTGDLLTINTANTASTNGGLLIQSAAAGSAYFRYDRSAGWPGKTYIGNNASAGSNAPTTAITIDGTSGGNKVGIGTTSPATSLQVNTPGLSLDGVGVVSGDGHSLGLRPSLGAGSYNPLVQNGDMAITYSSNTQGVGALAIVPWAAAASGIRMDGAGNVGIGVVNAGARLDAQAAGSTAADMAQLWRRGDGVVVGSMSATGVMMAAKFIGDGSALSNVSAGSVSGSINASQVNPGTFQNGDYIFQKQVSATGYRAAQGIPYSADSSTNGYSFGADGDTGMFSPIVGGGAANGILAFYANNAEAMRISGGNVGISTVTPGYLLTNVGNVRPIFGGPQTDQAGLAPAPSAFVWGFDSYSGQAGYAAAIYNNRNCIGAGCGTALLVESYYANANPTNALITVNNGSGDVFTIRGNGNVGIGTNSPNASAALDVASTAKGMLPPRMSTAQRDAIVSPVAGLFIYNTTNTQLELYNGTAWVAAGAGLATGAIAAFSASACPAGWTEYTAARGRFLRGIDNGAGIDPDGTRAPGATQGDLLRSHSHTLTTADIYNTAAFVINDNSSDQIASSDNVPLGTYATLRPDRYSTAANGGAETRPANVAVIFCQFSGLGGGSAGSGATLVNGDIWVGNASNVAAAVAVSGDATLSNAGVLAIANSAISSAKIADGAIMDVDVNAAAAVAGTKISPNFGAQNIVTTGKIGVGTTAPDGALTVQGSLEERDSGDAFRMYKNLASYNVSSPNSAGTVKISLPSSKVWSNTMLRVVIKGYDYSGSGAWEVVVGGYNYNSPGSWINTSAEIRGSAPFNTVRLAHDGTANVILLGTLANNLQYPKIRVDEVLAGHNNYTGWGSGWLISQITSEAAITDVVTPAVNTYAYANGTNATGSWPISITGTSAGAAPSGAAGGNLNGTYPNPGIASLPAISGAALTNLTAGNISAGTAGINVTGNAGTATKLNSQGDYAAATPGTTRGPAGLNMFQVYSNGYPIPYGNLLHMTGAGGGQLLVGWSGVDGANADNYIRSKRDNDAGAWSPWAKILTDVNFNSYAPTLTGTGASGSWPISITGSAGSVSGNAAGINVVDIRDTSPTPDAIIGDRTVSAQFNNQWVGGWRSALTVAGWTDAYSVWQLMGGSDTSSSENWYLRSGVNATWNAWREVMHSGNIGSQTVANVTSLAGTWWGTNYFGSNKGAASTVGANSTYGLEAFSNDGGAAGMSFHRGGFYAVNMGLDPDNVLRIGGWSAPANLLQMDMSGNLTMAGSYNGSGAGLTGTAANLTAGRATYNSFQQHTNDWTADFNSDPAAQRGWAEQSAGGPQGTWWFMDNMRHSNGSNYWGTQIAWGWEDNSNQLWQRNVSAGTWSGWVKYLNSGNYNSYAPTLTGAGASGTWGINVTGTAASLSGNDGKTGRESRLYRSDGESSYTYYIRHYWTSDSRGWRITANNDNADEQANIHRVSVDQADIAGLGSGRTQALSTDYPVSSMMRWKNYGVGHVIFDASASLSPDGTAINNTTAQVDWAATYPTLMGWNGANTYGVRVARAARAETAPLTCYDTAWSASSGCAYEPSAAHPACNAGYTDVGIAAETHSDSGCGVSAMNYQKVKTRCCIIQ